MTDPQTPATEAGRRHLQAEIDDFEKVYGYLVPGDARATLAADILAIEAEARASLDVDVVKLQWAMRRAHGRRISLTETYAEAIARVYNGDEYRAILDPQP
jgi:hypothetical protein